jgi:hypothetical protein
MNEGQSRLFTFGQSPHKTIFSQGKVNHPGILLTDDGEKPNQVPRSYTRHGSPQLSVPLKNPRKKEKTVLGMVAHTYNPRYLGGGEVRIAV